MLPALGGRDDIKEDTTYKALGAPDRVRGQPTSGFVTNTTIENSAGDGVVRGWTGTPVDVLASNTFTGITRCNQTYPKPCGGACPVPAPCPR